MSIPKKGSVTFFAFIDEGTANIGRKVEDYCEGLRAQGYQAEPALIKVDGFLNRINRGRDIAGSQFDILILRNSIYTPFLFLFLIGARLKGRKLIIEMPTPLRVMVYEVWRSDRGFLPKLLLIIMLYLFFPISLWPAHRILNYSNESFYFSIGLKKKSRLITNGIHTDRIPVRSYSQKGQKAPVTLIGVAMFQPSHGYERMIRSIQNYLEDHSIEDRREVKLILVGDGELRKEWEELVEKLSLTDRVEFTGVKTGKELDEIFEQADIAVGKLAPYKINLQIASELKLRGYCARGIPFIKSYEDPDFPEGLEFVYSVENSSALIDIDKVLQWYDELDHQYLTDRIRHYAETHLDYKKKELLYL